MSKEHWMLFGKKWHSSWILSGRLLAQHDGNGKKKSKIIIQEQGRVQARNRLISASWSGISSGLWSLVLGEFGPLFCSRIKQSLLPGHVWSLIQLKRNFWPINTQLSHTIVGVWRKRTKASVTLSSSVSNLYQHQFEERFFLKSKAGKASKYTI